MNDLSSLKPKARLARLYNDARQKKVTLSRSDAGNGLNTSAVLLTVAELRSARTFQSLNRYSSAKINSQLSPYSPSLRLFAERSIHEYVANSK